MRANCYDCAVPNELMLVGQAARRYGIPRRTLYSAIEWGRLPAQEVGAAYGKHYLVTEADVQHWIRTGKHTPGPAKKRKMGRPAPERGQQEGR